jgi:hypothetical protein
MTQFALEVWQTPETINEIWARLGWLNLNLATTNLLLGTLIVVLRGRVQPKPEEKKDGAK